MISEASDAVKRFLNNGEIIETEYTNIFAAPPQFSVILPFTPVKLEGMELYFLQSANGDPTKFTSDNLLTMYRDYIVPTGPNNTTHSETGIVRSLNGIWSVNFQRPIYSLTTEIIPNYGSMKVVYTAGYTTIPDSIKAAVNLIVKKLYAARNYGQTFNSESLSGYSYSLQGAATAQGILWGDPTIRQLLAPFARPQVGGYY